MKLTLQPVRIADGNAEGMLVFANDEQLLAVLVRLSDRSAIAPGRWCLEAGFGELGWTGSPIFADLDAAREWISQRFGNGLNGSTRKER
jgi:hypothetical protein